MLYADYEIKHYCPDFKHEVVNVLRYLWGANTDVNLSYFEWKYEHNPHAEDPLGIVALHHATVVGFRGYFVTSWHIPDILTEIEVLCPGDTCVHPEHRRSGLSVSMGKMAMQEYASKYRLFLNSSATRNSVPGYLRLGFRPLKDKTYLNRCNLMGLIRFNFISDRITELPDNRIRFGETDNILVSETPRPKEMYQIICTKRPQTQKLTLLQDEVFFEWRFNNKRKRYVFYFCKKNGLITGYVVTRIPPNKRRGYIIDYADTDNGSLEEILRFIIKMNHFDVLSIYNISISDSLLETLQRLRFKSDGLIRAKDKNRLGECPLLIRPVNQSYSEHDWYLEGLDMRRIENWDVKEICCDGV